MKRKLSLAFLALVWCAVAAPAVAADLPLPVKAPLLPPYDAWNGWYVGGNVGGSFGQARDKSTFGPAANTFSSTTTNLNGVVGGAQFGYNWHVNPVWLLGFEADIHGTGERGTATSSLARTISVFIPGIGVIPLTQTGRLSDAEKLPWFGTVRGRVGWTPTPTWLVYVTGGLAYGEIFSDPTLAVGAGGVSVANRFNTVRAGWTAGGGGEVFVAPNWTVFVEYLYVDFGSFSNTFNSLGFFGPTMTLNTHVTDNVVLAGFNYHFPPR
jgi:outer membrane immunogenic protein